MAATGALEMSRAFRGRVRAWWRGNNDRGWNAPSWTMPHGQWTTERAIAAQLVWGDDWLAPWNRTEINALVTLLNPLAGDRIVVLGDGLGGMARALVHATGVNVIAIETDPTLLALVSDRRDTRVRSVSAIPANDGARFDHLVFNGWSLDAPFPDFTMLARMLAPAATLIVRAYVDDTDRLTAQADDAGLAILSDGDITEAHVRTVESGWATAVDTIRIVHRDPERMPLIAPLLAEAERWRTQIERFRAGAASARLIELTHARG